MLNKKFEKLPSKINIKNSLHKLPNQKTAQILQSVLKLTKGRSIDDIYVNFYNIYHNLIQSNHKDLADKLLTHSHISIIKYQSDAYFDKYSVIKLTISNGKEETESEKIKLDSEINSGNSYFINPAKNILYFDKKRLTQPAPSIVSIHNLPQFGATCKLVSVGNINRYFFGDVAKPVYKNQTGRYKKYLEAKSESSIRQLAKSLGISRQGEVLDINHLKKLFEKLQLKASIHEFNNLDKFRSLQIKALKDGKAVMVFFSVNTRARAHGDVYTEGTLELFEHCAMVTGYDEISDKFRLSHWGNHYWQPAKDIYISSANLVQTRSEEYYTFKNRDSDSGEWKYKQQITKDENGEPTVLITPKPKNGSGFRNKMIIVEKTPN